MAKTIDNLGVDISTRYAEDRELFDESFIRDARTVTVQTSITSTLPAHLPEFDLLFDLTQRKATWATFLAPPHYYATRRRLFAEQVIPEIGTPDKQETQLLRVEAVGDEEKKRHTLPTEVEQVEQEKQTLLKLLNKLHNIDELLIAINSRRDQYQKG
jgi:DNA-binding transcriptional regulator GbsR (MarR family)